MTKRAHFPHGAIGRCDGLAMTVWVGAIRRRDPGEEMPIRELEAVNDDPTREQERFEAAVMRELAGGELD